MSGECRDKINKLDLHNLKALRLLSQQQNVFEMKQPELGKRIAELRQSKGLTQEELVERCNINVRTIQRIEAGEVTPRMFTVKAIFDALESSLNDLFPSEQDETGALNKNILLLGVIGAILFIFTGVPEGFMDYVKFSDGFSDIGFGFTDISNLSYLFIKLLSMTSMVLLMLSFVHIGEKKSFLILKIGAYSILGLAVLTGLLDILSLYVPLLDEAFMIIIIFEVILYALTGLIFGIGLLMARDQLGDLALIAGILEITIGVMVGSFILAFMGLILLIPATVFEMILLIQLYRKQGN